MFWLKKWLGGLLMPLPFTLMLIVLGLLLLWFTRRQRLGKSLCTLGTLLLLTLSLRPVSVELLRPLEQQFPPFPASQSVDFILVLGHGHVSDPTIPLTSQPISNAYARIAEHYGIPRRDMILIEDAYDTHDEVTRYQGVIGNQVAALVTSASHMPRAMALARQLNLRVIPAPTDYQGRLAQALIPSHGYLPQGRYLMYSEMALHEWIGAIWHQWRQQSKE